jgi:hypothetical protein
LSDTSTDPSNPQNLPAFSDALSELVAVARAGHAPASPFFNPPDEWLITQGRLFSGLSDSEREDMLAEWSAVKREGDAANGEGKAAVKAGPEVVVQLDSGGYAFYSQRGVARQPHLTRYFVEGFTPNRDSFRFDVADQELFAPILPLITDRVRQWLADGEMVVQSDRRIGDAPGRSFHARQLVIGSRYPQLAYLWRQLTFEMPQTEQTGTPDIIEFSFPEWLETLDLPADLRHQVEERNLTRLVLKAPNYGLSLHLGFDYVGEHKMGPLSIAMHQTKERNGLALQAALSVARVRSLDGKLTNAALVTTGPSLHGKSTLTIMIELAGSELSEHLGLSPDPEEGVYPMNDDIVLLQPLATPIETEINGHRVRYAYGIDGTENNFYAVPSGLTKEGDPLTYDVVRGSSGQPNPQETLENVVVDPASGIPDFGQNPTRNMRMILSRSRLLERKGVQEVISKITGGRLLEAAHVPMENMDRILWQAVMRENTIVPPLRRLRLEQYVRVLMYGEAVQMGAAAGAIGRPYVEYFSDPFIIGLEDENANALHFILQQMERGGVKQEFYAFNTGGLGADTNDAAEGAMYKKIPRELTLMLQEAVLRNAIKFVYDADMGAEIAVAIVDASGDEVVDLRKDWLPRSIYGEAEYRERILGLRRRRYFGSPENERTGILRYTRVSESLIDLSDVPVPRTEWELARLMSFYWHEERSYETLDEVVSHRSEGLMPARHLLRALAAACETGAQQGLPLHGATLGLLKDLGVRLLAAPK